MKLSQPILTVERTAMLDGVQRLRQIGKQSSDPVGLEFLDGALTITWADSSEQVPAQGQWPVAVHVPAGWIRACAKALPPEDPLTIRIADGHVVTESFSCPIVDPAEQSELISAQDRLRRIADAAGALKAFRLDESDIEYLIDKSELEDRHRYHPDEDRLLKSVAKAWASLAVFGVNADEIYRLLQQRIRQAWNTGDRGA